MLKFVNNSTFMTATRPISEVTGIDPVSNEMISHQFTDFEFSELAAFLVTAKKATYATGNVPSEGARPGTNSFKYSQGQWLYIDEYFGAGMFVGTEVVYFSNKPVWAMSYSGFECSPDPEVNQAAIRCLCSALSRVDESDIPVRGVKTRLNGYSYIPKTRGSLIKFNGREVIEKINDHKEVFYCNYSGGLIVT